MRFETINLVSSRIHRLLTVLKQLKAGDFPYESSRVALAVLESQLLGRVQELERLRGRDHLVIAQYCARLAQELDWILQVTGLLLRSTHTRNSFESFYGLQQIISQLTSDDVRLIFSTEWDYIPYTYPLNIPFLEKFVTIGLPVTEVDNVFLLPLSAHEMGHTVWVHHRLRSAFEHVVDEVALRLYLEREAQKSAAAHEELFHDLVILSRIGNAAQAALRQLEELFCDLVGLLIFGEAFVYAFVEYMIPGEVRRPSLEYPTIRARIRTLLEFGAQLGIDTQIVADEMFVQEQSVPSNVRLEERIADATRSALASDVFERARAIITSAGLASPDADVVEQVATAMKMGHPYEGSCSMGEALSGAWRCRLAAAEPLQDQEQRRMNEIAFKTLEVLEFRQR